MKATPAGLVGLFEATRRNGGATYDFYSGLVVEFDEGYAVSIAGGTTTGAGPEDFHDFGKAALEVMSNAIFNGLHYIGTWIDNGVLYIDPVIINHDYIEAANIAKENAQIAFYGFAEHAAILTKEAVNG